MAGVPVTWVAPRSGAEPRLVLYVHGGAFTVGSSQMIRDLLARLALASRARVLSVDYRLAPEHPWPAALEDVRAVWRAALVEHAPKQVVVAGDSAGGNLVLALLCALRDARRAARPRAPSSSRRGSTSAAPPRRSPRTRTSTSWTVTSLPARRGRLRRGPGPRRPVALAAATANLARAAAALPPGRRGRAAPRRRRGAAPPGRAPRASGWRSTSGTTRCTTSRRSARSRGRASRRSPGQERRSRCSRRC